MATGTIQRPLQTAGMDKRVILIGDSYGLDTASWTGWQTAFENISSFTVIKSAVGGSGFIGDPNEDTFLEQLTALNVTNGASVTDIVVLGGYNDASLGYSEAQLGAAVQDFSAYCAEHFPLSKIHYGFIAVDYNSDGMQATLNQYRFMFERICAEAGIAFIPNAPYILLNRALIHIAANDANSGFHPNTTGNLLVARKLEQYLDSGYFDVVYGETVQGTVVYAKNGEVSIQPNYGGYSFSQILPEMTYPFNTWTVIADFSSGGSDLLWGTHDDSTTVHFWANVYNPNGLAGTALFRILDKKLAINPLNNASGLTLNATSWACFSSVAIPMQTNY